MGYILAFFVYIFFPSTKIQGNVMDKNNKSVANVKISIDYSQFQVDVMEDVTVETITNVDGSFRAKLKKCGKDYPITVFVISGNDTIASKKISEIKRRLSVTMTAEQKK